MSSTQTQTTRKPAAAHTHREFKSVKELAVTRLPRTAAATIADGDGGADNAAGSDAPARRPRGTACKPLGEGKAQQSSKERKAARDAAAAAAAAQ